MYLYVAEMNANYQDCGKVELLLPFGQSVASAIERHPTPTRPPVLGALFATMHSLQLSPKPQVGHLRHQAATAATITGILRGYCGVGTIYNQHIKRIQHHVDETGE